jgi:tetratricopeptide (TPR) repeat protein
MRRNEELFRRKWAARDPVGQICNPSNTRTDCKFVLQSSPYGIKIAPGGGLLLVRKEIGLSLCMMVRNSAGTLEACLRSNRPWVDEIIVVDTGSTDDTVRIAERFGARVFHFPWCDSFAAARNESLKHARGRWIFWMDSDDTIDEANGRKLREMAARDPGLSVLGYVVQVHCPGPGPDGEQDVTVVDHVKLFRNLPHLRFTGRIREQILPAIRRAGGETAWTDVFVVHSGYDHSPEGQERKKQRDLHLLHLELHEQPNHPFTLFNLGMTCADIGEPAKAVDYLQRSIRLSGEAESHLRKAYSLLAWCQSQCGLREAAEQVCCQGLQLFPEDVELRFRHAILLHEAGRLVQAAEAYRGILAEQDGPRYFNSMDQGIRGFKCRQNLALVYADLGDWTHAEEQWRQIVAEAPHYRQGWRGLGDVLLRQGKTGAAEILADRMLTDSRLRIEGMLLKAHAAAARGDLAAARQHLRRAVADYPDDPDPLQALCRFLFENGGLAEADESLQELTRREPRDAAAFHNLGTLRRRLGRPAAAAEAFRQSLRLRPNAPATLLNLGHALRDSGQVREAVAAWQEAARAAPGRPEAAEAQRAIILANGQG